MIGYKETQTIDLSKGVQLDGDICKIYDDYIVLDESGTKKIYLRSNNELLYQSIAEDVTKLENSFLIEGLQDFHKTTKYDLVNFNGKKIVKHQCGSIPFSFSKGRILLNDSGRGIGVMYDYEGKEIYRCGPISKFNNDLFDVYDAKKSYKKGLIDVDGNIKLDKKYSCIYDYNNEYYVVKTDDLYGIKWYLYNKKTNKKKRLKNVLNFKKLDQDRFVYESKERKYILIDDNFNKLKELNYDKMSFFISSFSLYENNLCTISSINDLVIDKNGNVVLEGIGEVIDIFSNEILIYNGEKKILYIYDHKGSKIKEFDNVTHVDQCNKLIQFKQSGKDVVINSQGKILSDTNKYTIFKIENNVGDKYLISCVTTSDYKRLPSTYRYLIIDKFINYKVIDADGNDIIPEITQCPTIGKDTFGIENRLFCYNDFKINYNLCIKFNNRSIDKSFDTVEARNRYKEVFEDTIQSRIKTIDSNTQKIIDDANEEKDNLFDIADEVVSKKLIKNLDLY